MDPVRSLAANILNRYATSLKHLDEVMAVAFAERPDLSAGRRHRVRGIAQEVVRRSGTIDQILKVYATRDPGDMEHHVRTVLRIAIAEWFLVPPPGWNEEARARYDAERKQPRLSELLDDDGGPGIPAPPAAVAISLADPVKPRGAANPIDPRLPVPTRPSIVVAPTEGPRRDPRARRRSSFAKSKPQPEPPTPADVVAAEAAAASPSESASPASNTGSSRGETAQPPMLRGPITASVVNLVGNNRSSRSFVNGILRAIDRDVEYYPDWELTPEDTPRNAIPSPTGGTFLFGESLFADPEKKASTWLGQYASIPKWLAERFIARYPMTTAIDIATALNGTPALSVRVNTRKTTPEAVKQTIAAHGAVAHETPLPEVLRVDPPIQLTATPLFEEGLIYLQDLTAARTVNAVELTPGMRILDACAAPGGKITHLCEKLDGQATLVALDASRRRLRLLQENLDRLGHNEIKIEHGDLREYAAATDARYDLVFVDAPCSNTGVLARRTDARWRLNDELLESLNELQLEMVAAASTLLAEGGRLVYSTCSIEPEECRGLLIQTGLELLHDEMWLPEVNTCDGGYTAILRRPAQA